LAEGLKPVVLSRRAVESLRKTRRWYAEQAHEALAERFGQEIRSALDTVRHHPKLYQEVRPGYRRIVLTHFPYSITYREESVRIVVVQIVHQARKPLD
jgi:plasmid stabilization system protein ParE